MEDSFETSTDIVHPEVRAHINSLVSALGGPSPEDDGQYLLGDSALEVLRDVKKWIRFYDEKTNRMDVARCLAEANIVGGDLLHILAGWPQHATENKFRARVSLACIEIISQLTWPLDRNPEEMTVNHHRHMPVLQLAQVGYKRAIINYDAAQILHTAVRVALPSMAMERSERTTRDEGIIKLLLLFLRNIAMIAPPVGIQYDGDESQVSRNALIDAFSFQDILLTILTIASNMGEDFNHEGVLVMEIIFHLVKCVDVEKLFMDDKQLSHAKATQLKDLINKEAAMHRPHNRKAPTRHSRWGAMIWVQRDGGKMSAVSGQDALLDAATREEKMDSSKVYRPPKRQRKKDMESRDLGPSVSLNTRARQQLRGFVEELLDSGFNPLFLHIRKQLDEQKEHVFDYHYRQFFYLVSWFLEAERVRQKASSSSKKKPEDGEVGSFNLVASVLNQEMFITLSRSMAEANENKDWQQLCASMRCFSQILLTVSDMSESGNEENEEIAENILSRIFYEKDTHDLVATIARGYKDQGFEYLDSCTELTHTYLRVLEAYSKQNVDMQVRSRQRTRKKKKAAKAADGEDNAAEDEDESDNDQAKVEKTSIERKFDFGVFANKFIPQGVVDTFVAFTKFYTDLSDAQLKRAHRYFYRLAFKQNMSVMLFRADIIHLFHGMIKGSEPLDKKRKIYKEWEELSRQILKKCIRKIDERPALIIEMLFSKINATAHYLEYGYEKQTMSTSAARPAAELEFRHIVERDQQIGVAVGALLDKNLAHHIKWLKEQLLAAESERRAWELMEKALPSAEATRADLGENHDQDESTTAEPAKEAPTISIRPEDDARRNAVFKNGHLRLLMKLVGIERLTPSLDETPESSWVIPPPVTADQLQDSVDLINKAEFDPPNFEDGKLAAEQLRRKTAPRKKAAFDDDDQDDVDDEDLDGLFPAGGPTMRKIADEHLGKPKTKRLRRRRGSDAEPPTEEQLEERAKKRRQREKEKARKLKSELYVHASDDDTDEERDRDFFENEERLRLRQAAAALERRPPSPKLMLKRKAPFIAEDDSEDDDDVDDSGNENLRLTQNSASGSSRTARGPEDDDEDGSDASDTDDTPLSSSPPRSKKRSAGHKRRRLSEEPASSSGATPAARDDADMADAGAPPIEEDKGNEEDDEDEPVVSKTARRRPRAKAGFIIDSSDEE